MPARPELVATAWRLCALGLLAVVGCASERSEPAGAPEVSTVEDSPATASSPDAEAELPNAGPSGMATDLASVEAALADYEARLARAGVAVPRRGVQLGGAADGEDAAGAATATPLDDASAGSGATSKSDEKELEAKKSSDAREQAQRPARHDGGKDEKPRESRRDSRRANKGSRRSSGKSGAAGSDDADRDFAPPPPGDAPAPVVGGAIAENLDPEAEASRLDPRPRCEELCSLEEAICALETRVCDLAESHRWDRRYVEACTRAGEDCSAAHRACETCTPEGQ